MAERPLFQRTQYEFTAHLRDPDNVSGPKDIEDRRMGIYRDLLFNNVNSFLQSGFPVLHSLYSEEDWTQLARTFFAQHKSKSPYFLEISEEFLDFLENEYQPKSSDPAFLLELAHYEWVELALMTSQETPTMEGINRSGDLLKEIPTLSPLAECLSYLWPVQNISPDYQPTEPPDHLQYIIVYRNAKTDEIGFMDANPVTARLFELMREDNQHTGRQLLEQISTELQHPNPETVVQGGHQILLKLHHAYVITGTKA